MKQTTIKNELITKLKKKNIKLCIAESMTGGNFAYEFIKNKGASSYVDFSLVCYSKDSKKIFLDLENDLKKNDVVSENIAKKMAINITSYSKHYKTMGVSCTGLASDFLNKNLSKMSTGTVFFAAYFNKNIRVKKKVFKGLARNQIISRTIKEMIMLCNSFI